MRYLIQTSGKNMAKEIEKIESKESNHPQEQETYDFEIQDEFIVSNRCHLEVWSWTSFPSVRFLPFWLAHQYQDSFSDSWVSKNEPTRSLHNGDE